MRFGNVHLGMEEGGGRGSYVNLGGEAGNEDRVVFLCCQGVLGVLSDQVSFVAGNGIE